MIKLSIVIPGYFDVLSVKTINSLLENSELGDALEIIYVCDGFWPSWDLVQDPRVRYIHLGANRGMRGAINAGMSVARGEFVGRMDEHCDVGKGYDRILVNDCQPNTIISPRRYFLNPEKWENMPEEGYVDYEKLVIQDMGNGVRKFSGQKWISRTKERANIMVDENQAIQGSFWVMPKQIWDNVVGGELRTDIFGPTYQDSVEVCMANWKAGGKLLLTKNTWYSHKHRKFPRTHQEGSPENPSHREASWTASLNMFEDYYKNELLPRWNKI
jgi:glycosyltransferase involved in cell wall biosynthesis